MSEYEIRLTNELIHEIVKLKGYAMEKEDCIDECWVVYLENRAACKTQKDYWDHMTYYLIRRMEELRVQRNRRFRVESRISYNGTMLDSDEQIGDILFASENRHEDSIAFWNFIEGLGTEKCGVAKCLALFGDDDWAMRRMNISKERYDEIKEELKADMMEYLEL